MYAGAANAGAADRASRGLSGLASRASLPHTLRPRLDEIRFDPSNEPERPKPRAQPFDKAAVPDRRVPKFPLGHLVGLAVGRNPGKEQALEVHEFGNTGKFPNFQEEFPGVISRILKSLGRRENSRMSDSEPEAEPMAQTHLQALLRREMKERGLNQHSMAAAAGLGPDGIRDILRKSAKNPHARTLHALSNFLNKSIPDLLGVSGVVVGMPEESAAGPRPSSLPSLPDHTPRLDGVAEVDVLGGLGSGGEAVVEAFTVNDTSIISGEAVKDYWVLPEDYLRGELRVSRNRVRLMEVRGDSMAPTLGSGDRVMVDLRDKLPSPGGMFAYYDGFGVSVKRIEIVEGMSPPTLRLSSDNPNHGTYTVSAEEAHIIGRVILQIRRV